MEDRDPYIVIAQSSALWPWRGVKGSDAGRRRGSWAHVLKQGALTGLNSGLSDLFGITTSVK